jgi:hypothetical protein
LLGSADWDEDMSLPGESSVAGNKLQYVTGARTSSPEEFYHDLFVCLGIPCGLESVGNKKCPLKACCGK